jgi:hypothetical protein
MLKRYRTDPLLQRLIFDGVGKQVLANDGNPDGPKRRLFPLDVVTIRIRSARSMNRRFSMHSEIITHKSTSSAIALDGNMSRSAAKN